MIQCRDHGAGPGGAGAAWWVGHVALGLTLGVFVVLSPSAALAQYSYLIASPPKLSFECVANQADPPPERLILSLASHDSVSWDSYGYSPEMNYVPIRGLTPCTLSVRVHLEGRPSGIYHDTIRVSAPQAFNSPFLIPVDTRVLAAPRSDSDFVTLWPPEVNISSAAVETSFVLAVQVDLATTLGAIALPLTLAGHSGLHLDTSVSFPPDHVGMRLGPAGRDTAWTITTALHDPDRKTLLLGFISFSKFAPVADTLVYFYFKVDSSGQTGRVRVDTATVGPNQLTITDTTATEYMPVWTPAEIRIGHEQAPSELCVSPQDLYFESYAYDTLPVGHPLSIGSCSQGALSWSAAHHEPWLMLSSHAGFGEHTDITVQMVTTYLDPGWYYDTIAVSSEHSANSPVRVAVAYRIFPDPPVFDSLKIEPDTLHINGPYHDTTMSVSLLIHNRHALAGLTIPLRLTDLPHLRFDSSVTSSDGYPAITWGSAGAHAAWTIHTVQIEDSSRSMLIGLISFSSYPRSRGVLAQLHLALDSSDAPGSAEIDSSTVLAQHLRVRDAASNYPYAPSWSPGVIRVSGSLSSPGVCLETDALQFEATYQGPLPADQQIRFHNCSGGAMGWSVSDDAGWLELTPASGLGADARVTAHVNTTQLPTGVHWAIVTIRNQTVPTDERHLRVSYRLDSTDNKLYLWPDNILLPANRDTTFTVPLVMREVSGLYLVGIQVPLTYAGAASNVWLDTLVEDGFGNRGVTQGPLGASTVWNIRIALADPVLQTVLVGYISFGNGLAGPQHDTLAVLHFRVSAQPGTQVFTIDTTQIHAAHLLIADFTAMEPPVEWAGATVTFGTTGLSEDPELPSGFALAQNVPNPFNAATSIGFSIPSWANGAIVSVVVHDVLGRRVRTLVAKALPAGAFQSRWDGTDDRGAPVASSVYFIVLETESARIVRKALLLR